MMRIIARFLRLQLSGLLAAGLVLIVVNPCIAAFLISSSEPTNLGLPRQWAPGDSVTLKIMTSGASVDSYQWLHDDVPIPGATAASMTLSNLGNPDSGNYRLRITSGTTTEISDNTVTINVLPLPPSPVDTTFSSTLPSPANVSSVRPFAADGSMIVSNFPSASTYQAFRLGSNGSLVSGFNFPSSAGLVLAGFPDGSLIVSNAPYRLNASGGTISFSLPTAFDATKSLSAAAVQADGKFYLAQGTTLMRFLSDGTVDPSFTFADSFEAGISGLTLDRNDRLYVYGLRTNPTPGAFPPAWPTFYRVTNTGTRDSNFSNQVAEPISYGILSVAPLDDGRLLYYSAYHGYRLWKILRDDGTPDPAWAGSTTFPERPIVVNRATGQLYITDTSYKLLRYTITATSLVKDDSFFPGITPLSGAQLTLDPTGRLIVFGSFTQWERHATSGVARVRPNDTTPVLPPNASIGPGDATPSKGSTLTFISTVTGTGPFTYQWLALDGQPLSVDTSSPQLAITNFSAANLGRYQLRVTGPGGVTVLSNVTRAIVGPQQPYLANLSGRAMTGSGEDTVIAGLVTKISAGALGLPALLRGAGPALKPLGVTNFLPNPAIDLFNSAGQLVANNDQWSVNPETASAALVVGAFGFAEGSNDAALLRSFPTGSATMMLKNQGQGDGIGLLEIYQRFPNGGEYNYQSLLNLSFRARTGPGEQTAIAGFVIADPQNFERPAKVLLRAVGPTLSSQGIAHPLENPMLTVYNSKSEVVAQNDDWPSHLTAEYTAFDAATHDVGAFPLQPASKDAALLVDLPAGAYTMHATGGTGVVLLEIYLVR